jgi:hypothetical protein
VALEYALALFPAIYEQQSPAWIGGQGTDPNEQNTQQSPAFGFSRLPQPLQS